MCGHAPAGLPHGVRRFIVRTGLALGALITARFVPFLGLVMALIGMRPSVASFAECIAALGLAAMKGLTVA